MWYEMKGEIWNLSQWRSGVFYRSLKLAKNSIRD